MLTGSAGLYQGDLFIQNQNTEVEKATFATPLLWEGWRRGGAKMSGDGGAEEGGAGPVSQLTNRVIRWSECASAQFSCPCF